MLVLGQPVSRAACLECSVFRAVLCEFPVHAQLCSWQVVHKGFRAIGMKGGLPRGQVLLSGPKFFPKLEVLQDDSLVKEPIPRYDFARVRNQSGRHLVSASLVGSACKSRRTRRRRGRKSKTNTISPSEGGSKSRDEGSSPSPHIPPNPTQDEVASPLSVRRAFRHPSGPWGLGAAGFQGETEETPSFVRLLHLLLSQLGSGSNREVVEETILSLAEHAETHFHTNTAEYMLAKEWLAWASGPEAVLDTRTLCTLSAGLEERAPQSKERLHLVTANVTSWRKEVLQWHMQQPDTLLLVQETHLDEEGQKSFRATAVQAGLHAFGGLGGPSNPRPKGGVAILMPRKEHGRMVQHFNQEGCGFVMVELPKVKCSLWVVSIYLQCSTGLQRSPNSDILAQLAAQLQGCRNWIIGGGLEH